MQEEIIKCVNAKNEETDALAQEKEEKNKRDMRGRSLRITAPRKNLCDKGTFRKTEKRKKVASEANDVG